MLKRILLMVCVLFAGIAISKGQGQLNFQKIFGGSGDDIGCSVLELTDRGFMIAGITNTYGAGGYDVLVMRTDSLGNTIWSKTYGGTQDEGTVDFNISWNVDMIQAPDGDFVICTNTKSFGAGGRDVYLLKIDANGKQRWARTYGGPKDDFGVGVTNDPNGGFVIVGSTLSYSYQNKGAIYIIKTNDTGGAAQAFSYSNPELTGYKIKPSADGGFIVCGIMNNDPNSYDAFVMKMDASFKILWKHYYGTQYYDLPNDIIELPDKSIYVTSQTWTSYPDANTNLMKFDDNGRLLWSKTWGTHDIKNIIYDPAKNILRMDGFVRLSGVQYLCYLQMDTAGNSPVMKSYGPVVSAGGYSTGQGANFLQLSSGGLAIIGTEVSFGFGNHDIYMLKTDGAGNINDCNVQTQSVSTTNFPLEKHDVAFTQTYQGGNIPAGKGGAANNILLKDSVFCPAFSADFSFASTCLKQGLSVAFKDASRYHAIKWTWFFGETGSVGNSSASQNPTHLYRTPGTYTVMLVATNGLKNDTITKDLVVSPFVTQQANKDSGVCLGDSAHLVVADGTFYHWNPDPYGQGDSSHHDVWVKPQGPETVTVRVSNANGCFVYDTFRVRIDSSLGVDLGPDRYLCPGSSLLLNTHISDTSVKITWQDGSHLPLIVANNPGKYVVTVKKGTCAFTDSTHVFQVKKPVAFIGIDTTICNGESYFINLKNLPLHTKILWQDNSEIASYYINTSGVFTVKLQNECGSSQASILVKQEECDCKFMVPNAFTPGNDSINEQFKPIGCPYPLNEYEFMVYNRWGELLYLTEDPHKGWDGRFQGKLCPAGVYVYLVTYKHRFEIAQFLRGTVTVVR